MSQGQITLPLAVRERLGVAPGDVVAFDFTPEGIRVSRVREPGAFDKWTGRFRTGRGQTAAEIDGWLRSMRGRDDE